MASDPEKHTGDGAIPAESAWAIPGSFSKIAEHVARLSSYASAEAPAEQFKAVHGEDATPTDRARNFFGEQLQVLQDRNRHFGGDLASDLRWEIMLRLMIVRLGNRGMPVDHLRCDCSSDPVAIADAIELLVGKQMVESFFDPDQPDRIQICLAGETARRMIEIYRARNGVPAR